MGVPPLVTRQTWSVTDLDAPRWIYCLFALRAGDPVEIYRDFRLSARNAAWGDGDYVEAVFEGGCRSRDPHQARGVALDLGGH
jgi:hypothetical protein